MSALLSRKVVLFEEVVDVLLVEERVHEEGGGMRSQRVFVDLLLAAFRFIDAVRVLNDDVRVGDTVEDHHGDVRVERRDGVDRTDHVIVDVSDGGIFFRLRVELVPVDELQESVMDVVDGVLQARVSAVLDDEPEVRIFGAVTHDGGGAHGLAIEAEDDVVTVLFADPFADFGHVLRLIVSHRIDADAFRQAGGTQVDGDTVIAVGQEERKVEPHHGLLDLEAVNEEHHMVFAVPVAAASAVEAGDVQLEAVEGRDFVDIDVIPFPDEVRDHRGLFDGRHQRARHVLEVLRGEGRDTSCHDISDEFVFYAHIHFSFCGYLRSACAFQGTIIAKNRTD